MRKITVTIIALSFLAAISGHAQDSIPYITGTVHLSVAQGTIECDLTMQRHPFIEDYLIRINSGMNIRYFKSLDGGNKIYYDRSVADSTGTDESNDYSFPADPKVGGKFLPKAIRFRYTGKYPIVRDTTMAGEVSVIDWRGNIACNGYSIRADGLQSCWYPVLYDIKTKKRYERVKFDLDIDCPDCQVIYINGMAPVTGTHAHFHSDVPRELFLFAGNFPVVNSQGTYFLDPGLNESQLLSFTKMTTDIKRFYESRLGVPFTDPITYVQAGSTAPEHAFTFVAFPSIVNVSLSQYSLSSFGDPRKNTWLVETMSHELGHFYFGTLRSFNTFFDPVLDEGLAEFLALNVLQSQQADSIYQKTLARKIKALKDFKPLPFTRLRSEADFHDRELYVYYFTPIVFLAIQKEIGDKATWEWMRQLLQLPTRWTDYAFLEATLKKALGDDARLAALRAKYFDSDEALANALEEIGTK